MVIAHSQPNEKNYQNIMKNTTSDIRKRLEQLDEAKNGKLKSLIFEDSYLKDYEDFNIDNEEPAPEAEVPAQPAMDEPAAPAKPQSEPAMEEPVGEPIEPTENTANNPEIDKIFSTIRYSVISGLAKLANQSTTVEYDTLKKILAIVDKPVESRANNK